MISLSFFGNQPKTRFWGGFNVVPLTHDHRCVYFGYSIIIKGNKNKKSKSNVNEGSSPTTMTTMTRGKNATLAQKRKKTHREREAHRVNAREREEKMNERTKILCLHVLKIMTRGNKWYGNVIAFTKEGRIACQYISSTKLSNHFQFIMESKNRLVYFVWHTKKGGFLFNNKDEHIHWI